MDDVESLFSRREMGNFLEELAGQVKNGRISIEIPGYSKGNAKITPKQPIRVVFDKEEDGSMTVKIEFEEKRDIWND